MAGKNDESVEGSSNRQNSDGDLSFNSESDYSRLKDDTKVQADESHDKSKEAEKVDTSDGDSEVESSKGGIPTNITTDGDETSATPNSKLTNSETVGNDDDDDNDDGDQPEITDRLQMQRSVYMFQFLRLLKKILSGCSLVSSVLILSEIITLMAVINYDFIEYFLSTYFMIFTLILILGEIVIFGDIDSYPLRLINQRLMSQLAVRGFIYVFIAVSIMEQHKYAVANDMIQLQDSEMISTFFSIFNWAALWTGITYFLMGTFRLEEEINKKRVEFIEIRNRLMPSSSESGFEDSSNDDDNDESDGDLSSSSETVIPPTDEEEAVEEEEEPNNAPKIPFHNFLTAFPLATIFPTVLVLIEVFVMMCIIESYTFLELFVRAYFLVIGIIFILGEAVSTLPEDKRLFVREGFLKKWYLRGFLYIFFIVSVMQQHIHAKSDGSMEDTRIAKSDWDAGVASAFWGIFNWFAFVVYFIYLVLGLRKFEDTLDELDQSYEMRMGVYEEE